MTASRRRQISALAFIPEAQALQALLPVLAHAAVLEPKIMRRASAWVTQLRKEGGGSGIEAFLHEYGLGSSEGVAIMCLAEALLRIPDATTADRLIQGTFERARWERHLGKSDSFFVNASSWGLVLTGKVIQLNEEKPASLLSRLAGKFGEPAIREALKASMRFIGGQFVLGETIDDALAHAKHFTKQGYRLSYDMLGEGARSDAQAQAYAAAYRNAITRIGAQTKNMPLFAAPSLSVKLSGLHPRYQLAQQDRLIAELLPRLKEILLLAREHNMAVAIDAEESTRLDVNLLLFTALLEDKSFDGWNGVGFVVQAYQKRAAAVIDYLRELAERHHRTIPLRLVKGAYWDSEIKAAQLAGLSDYPVFTSKEHTDVSYLACAEKMLAAGELFYPQFATHNARTIASIEAFASHHRRPPGSFEFQRLHGMGERLHALVRKDHPCRIYAPVGRHKDLLAYLIRRLLENGANTSFVHLLMDQDTPIEELLADPVAYTREHLESSPLLPLPVDLYAARKNSTSMDFGNLDACETLQASLDVCATQETINVRDTGKEGLKSTVQAAALAFPQWSRTPVEKRCELLETIADKMEASRDACLYLLAREAGRTLADGMAEVREAADYCRYYAQQARLLFRAQTLAGPTGESNLLSLHPRGVFACISPWNFPLAIFTGQIAAALVTGNCVIAKPAEQTPQIAAFAVRLMHEAGVPAEALYLLPGSGETVGAALVSHPLVDGVVFTGSVSTAQNINRALAARFGPIVPLIAETGGQNCMVVDSSALPEQAVDDIVLSAFGSAGQRCSSLRVLFVQEDIADALIALLKGAMQELRLGDPLQFYADIGPVIDQQAQKALLMHIERMKREATFIASAALPKSQGHFVAPHAFEIDRIARLTGEVFGPILHVIRFKANERQKTADAINSTGYGLTFGIHSRIEENIEFFLSRIRAGNLYVNRSMIGATVGVQPFGGEGLSGTGPKAGGPHYLLKFLSERAVTINTAAIGGNITLLA